MRLTRRLSCLKCCILLLYLLKYLPYIYRVSMTTVQRRPNTASCVSNRRHTFCYFVRSIVSSVSVCLPFCLFVCLSVRLRISKTTRPNLTKFSASVTCCGHGSLFWRWCETLCTSRTESKTTHVFCPVRQVAASEAKSAVSGCILFREWQSSFRLMCDDRWPIARPYETKRFVPASDRLNSYPSADDAS